MASPATQPVSSSVSSDLRRRSKRGCIDCKAAKVRCDELRPSCGTCARRRRPCQGYAPPSDTATYPKERQQRFITYSPTNVGSKWRPSHSKQRSDAKTQASPPAEPTGDNYDQCIITSFRTESQPDAVQEEEFQFPASPGLTLYCEPIAASSSSLIPRSIPVIPPGTIPEDDAETINVYFNRHPFEQVISLEFVGEMNASVLMILQDSPVAVGDALYSIGRVYLEEEGQGLLLPLALERRAKALARLKIKDPSRELEEMLLTSLALSAMEVMSSSVLQSP